ncbi:MAG: hypothetical protein IAE82_01815 [Opitutaceae bacterium]|nr:hypothetical protein [Opitutaceae bacterium]
MHASPSTPLWLHILRISVLVAAAAGVAWVVASAQRRALRSSGVSAAPVPGSHESSAAGEAEVAVTDVSFDEIESEIILPDAVPVRLEPPAGVASPMPQAEVNAPALTLETDTEPVLTVPVFPFVAPVGDPYIGSSKSMVITPEVVAPGDPKARHGKP